ncbi:hypothetical protein INR49_013862 [Caranx melampygus]|nr:hypothetical protein INR49_013862 [Caranx melampygus]
MAHSRSSLQQSSPIGGVRCRQSFIFTVQSRPLSSHLTVLYADAVFLPGAEAQHPEAEGPPLGGLDQCCGRLVLPDWDSIDFHDIIAGPQTCAAGWRARRAVLHQQGAVSHDDLLYAGHHSDTGGDVLLSLGDGDDSLRTQSRHIVALDLQDLVPCLQPGQVSAAALLHKQDVAGSIPTELETKILRPALVGRRHAEDLYLMF